MSKAQLYFTVGLPRSGKSTFCKKWLNDMYLSDRPKVIICGDDFRTALHGHAYIPQAEGQVFAAIDTAARALLLTGFDVIIDETATTEATILRYLKIDIDARPIFMDADSSLCIARAKQDGKEFLVGPILRMKAQLEHLMKDWDATFARLIAYCESRQVQDVTV